MYVHYTNIDPTKKNVFKKLAEHEKVEFFIGQGYGNDNRKQAKNVISKGVQAASSGKKEGHGKGRQVSHGVRTLAYEGSGEEDVDLKAAVKTLAKQGVLNRKALHMTRKLLGSLIAITGAQEYVVALIKVRKNEREGVRGRRWGRKWDLIIVMHVYIIMRFCILVHCRVLGLL